MKKSRFEPRLFPFTPELFLLHGWSCNLRKPKGVSQYTGNRTETEARVPCWTGQPSVYPKLHYGEVRTHKIADSHLVIQSRQGGVGWARCNLERGFFNPTLFWMVTLVSGGRGGPLFFHLCRCRRTELPGGWLSLYHMPSTPCGGSNQAPALLAVN